MLSLPVDMWDPRRPRENGLFQPDPPQEGQGVDLCTRTMEAGFFASLPTGLMGRRTSSPPQFGQTNCNRVEAQFRQ